MFFQARVLVLFGETTDIPDFFCFSDKNPVAQEHVGLKLSKKLWRNFGDEARSKAVFTYEKTYDDNNRDGW